MKKSIKFRNLLRFCGRIRFFLLYYLLILVSVNIVAQNLVPNPSFEVYDTCPCGYNSIHWAIYWYNPGPLSTDYLNECSINGPNSVPNNNYGFQYARTGTAYSSVCGYLISGYRGYMGIELSDSLIQGEKYYVSFYVNLADSSALAIGEIGMYFSKTKITKIYPEHFPYTPQTMNKEGIISDMENWTLIQDTFTAAGGEKFITIGNFNDNFATDTMSTGIVGGIMYNAALYFIDDVSVTLYNSTSSINEIIIYPNPASDYLYLIISSKEFPVDFILYNSFGQIVLEEKIIKQNQKIIFDNLPIGIYFCRFNNQGCKLIVK